MTVLTLCVVLLHRWASCIVLKHVWSISCVYNLKLFNVEHGPLLGWPTIKHVLCTSCVYIIQQREKERKQRAKYTIIYKHTQEI